MRKMKKTSPSSFHHKIKLVDENNILIINTSDLFYLSEADALAASSEKNKIVSSAYTLGDNGEKLFPAYIQEELLLNVEQHGIRISQDGFKGSDTPAYAGGYETDGYRRSRGVALPRDVVANYIIRNIPGFRDIKSIGIGETRSATQIPFLLNAFSLQMLQGDATVSFSEVTELPKDLSSAIGHADTARVLNVPLRRINVSLRPGDVAYVAQLQGGRLPEGATSLPEGFRFKYIKVHVN